jgi:prepilin-type N-terminal cleavage/methylation domain-containing protein
MRPNSLQSTRARPASRAFTLLELMVVLGIIGLLAAITLPSLKNIRQSNTLVSAGRQLVDDLMLARARAISERTTVHVIFVPPDIDRMDFSATPDANRKVANRLLTGPFTTYALFAERTVGDQPGRPLFRYLTSWRSLPEGVFVAPEKFVETPAHWAPGNNVPDEARVFAFIDGRNLPARKLPFPTNYGEDQRLPHVAFDPQGRLVRKKDNSTENELRLGSEVIPLARGSILIRRDERTGAVLEFDVRESPPGNAVDNYHRVRIDGLTGRAQVETPPITP